MISPNASRRDSNAPPTDINQILAQGFADPCGHVIGAKIYMTLSSAPDNIATLGGPARSAGLHAIDCAFLLRE